MLALALAWAKASRMRGAWIGGQRQPSRSFQPVRAVRLVLRRDGGYDPNHLHSGLLRLPDRGSMVEHLLAHYVS